MRLSEEQIERASTVNLPQFLMANGFDLKKVGREYVWKEHDSLHIKDNQPGERGVWHRFSTNEGGDNIAFLRQYMNMSFVEAVEALNGEHYDRTYTPPQRTQHTERQRTAQAAELVLSENTDAKRAFAYLCKTRGLDYELVASLVKQGVIAQEQKTGNVLFKYYNDQGKVIGAEKVGTSTEHKFKGIATGSASGHGFEVCRGNGNNLLFFESSIDMLSYLQMHSAELTDHRLVSMMGVKPQTVIDTMERYGISPDRVYLCTDNDKAGNEFAERLMSEYPDMKRIVTPDTYKDWNDMLRGIPKKDTEIEQKTEVKKEVDRMSVGNKYWHNATSNADKVVATMDADKFQRIRQALDDATVNYFAAPGANGSIRIAMNESDVPFLRSVAGNVPVAKSSFEYNPPEKNIIGNAEYRYIPQKEYISADRDLILKMADVMNRQGIQFSGRIYPTGKGTLTVSHSDLTRVRAIRDDISARRRQVGVVEKGRTIGNHSVSAQNRHLYLSSLTPAQFEEVKPFIETNARYSGIIRDDKVMFAVDRDEAQAFHRALETAKREVGLIHTMQDLGLPMEQMIALSPVMHRLAAEDAQLQLSDFFDKRYDEAQFGEMLSLVNAYLDQPSAERYGEHSKLNDMLDAKSTFDRSIELADFFSQHDFNDEQKAAIANMFVGDVTRAQIEVIDETFTDWDIQQYDEILHTALQESDVADFLTAHKQTVIDRENASKEPTEEEVLFGQADLAKFIAERTPSSDEWEDMAYPLFENGYLDNHKPSDKAILGYHLSEQELYDLAERFHQGEDIRRELALGLLEGGNSADIEFVFEQGEMSERTYYYAENLRHSLHLDKTEDGYNCSFGGMERFVSFEEIGQAFLDRTQEEFDDLMYWRVLDYIRDDIPDISDETVQQLMTAFDGAALHGWENGDNQPKINRIKKALYDILGDEEQTEKAFACIAKQKYNVSFEPERQPDSLSFHFGKENDDWISESDLMHDFAVAHPDMSFALGNAIAEYLDEKQHSERSIPELKAGWYKKTDFQIHGVINGEEFGYEGRFDIGDGKGTGGGSLIDHIRDHAEGIMKSTQYPFNTAESKAQAKHTLDVMIPFLEAHSELTAEEQKILDDFKEQHPIRTYDDIEKDQSKFQIYQLPGGEKYHGVRFEGMEQLKADGVQLNHDDYELVYEGEIADFKGNATLEAIFAQFNTDRPADFTGHNLSVSDVVVIETEGKQTAYYCDTAGFTEMPEFFREKEIGLKEIIDRFFFDDIQSVETPDGEWRIASGGYDLVAEIYHNNTPVSGIINDIDGYEVNAYQKDDDTAKIVTDILKSKGFAVVEKADELSEEITDSAVSDRPTVADLEVGDIIMYDGARREIEEINDERIKMKDLDAPDYGGILLGTSDVLMYDGWQADMEEKGFEILSKAEKSEPVVEAPEKSVHQLITNAGLDGGIDDKEEYTTVDEAVKAGKDFLSDGYFGFAVFNTETKEIEHTEGDFPLTRAFNAEILAQNGIIEPEDKGYVTMAKVGDFYEMYGKNAEIAAEILDLHLSSKNGSPMVGFPDHVKDEYSKKLGEAGYTVLIEQAFEINPPKREVEQLTTLQDVVDKYFGTDCESAETDNGTWKLSIADGDKVGELFHNGEAVCGIYNRGDKMEIEPYAELTAFPKMLADAMLAHNPDKPVEIMDFKRTFETPLDMAKFLINEFCDAEYREEADFSDLHNVSLAYTTLTDDELPIQVTADLVDFKITYEFDGEVYNTEQYDSIEDMIENGLTGLDFSDLVSVPDEVIERHTSKDEQTVDLMSDAGEVQDISSQTDEPKPITMEFKGDSESLDEISDYALSIGAVVIKDNAHGTLSVDTYDNHQEELQNLAYMNGISCEVKDKSAPEQTADTVETPEADIDDDAPLFADADVIDEIQRNENDDVPFWETPDVQGEQLSLFGDPEPIQQTKPEKPKSEFAEGPVVDGVQVYEALGAEIDRGTGFVNGKLRVQEFYDENHPTTQQLADFLKDAYGTGGHSGEGAISLVSTDSKGMTFDFENGEKFRHSWYNVATMTKARLEDHTYLSAKQRTAYEQMKAEKSTLNPVDSRSEETDNSIKVGDKFRNRITGDISEVVSLEGAIPWQTDDVTITTDKGSYATTESISVDRLFNADIYEYLGNGDIQREQPEIDKSAPEKSEPVKADVEQTAELPAPKNLSQLKKAIQPGMMFEITDHQRPECVGERRVVTGVTTVDFTSRKLDENGEPTGKDIHMDFDRAKNWSFDGEEMTSHLEDGSVLMSFHFIDGLEREQTAEKAESNDYIPIYIGEWNLPDERELLSEIKAENERFAKMAGEVIGNGKNPVDSVKALTEEFGMERTVFLTALNIVDRPGDGRFCPADKEWACKVLSPFLEVSPDEVIHRSPEKERLFDRMINGGTLNNIHSTHLAQFAETLIPEYEKFLERSRPAKKIAPEQTAEEAFLSQVIERFDVHYDYLYQNRDQVEGYDKAVTLGDEIVGDNPAFADQIAELRPDFTCTDRETAALAFALVDVGVLEKFVDEPEIDADRAFLSQVIDRLNVHYDEMYQNGDQVEGYAEAVALGDEFLGDNPEFMEKLAEQRHDFISSDREMAALAFALVDVGVLEKFVDEPEISAEKSAPTLDVGDTIEYKGKEYQVESLDMDGYITLINPEINGAIKDRVTFIADEFINSGEYKVITPDVEKAPDKGDNFTITDDSLGEGGAKAKFRANVDAIKTLKLLEMTGRSATTKEQETLSKYVGWGALPQAFDKNDSKWSAEYAELKDLLTPQEYAAARATVNDAFFTSPAIIEGIYEALGNFGFEGGNVLEPSMGVGNFFGCMPSEMQEKSNLYGVEIDSISGRIAQALYPDADIAIQGFEKNSFQNGCFDVAVGNVPFGDLGFKDEKHGASKLHDYFFLEAMDKLKNGGVMAFVTSAGTLDKRDESVRQLLADKADLIGAIRLPGGKNGAFKDNAGSEVTTDIIFLQKREDKTIAEMSDIPDWVHIGETADGLPINKYFEQHPDMVLGTVVEGNKLYGSGTMVVAEDGFDLKAALHDAVGKLSAEISKEPARDVYAKTEQGLAVKVPSNLRNFSFFMQDDKIFFKKNNASFEQRFDKKNAQFARYKAFIELRDITRDLIEAQEQSKPDSVIKDLQAKLNTAYDSFYNKYGLIHSKTNKRYFNEDVSYNLVAGLEKKIDKDKLVEKSDIFTKRTICPPKAVECVETAMEALTLSIAEKARVDFDYMSKLTGMTEDELKHDLTGEIFKVPHTENTYQTASEYLSGDIRAKLREAEEVAEYDDDFNINVNALQKAMPESLKAGDIDVKIGATWLDPKYYDQFMYELLGTPDSNRADKQQSRWFKPTLIQTEYSDHANSWHISNKKADRSVLTNQKYGTPKMSAYEIFEDLLNLREPKLYKTIEVPDGLGDTKEKRVVDIDATRVVQQKAKEIKKAFKAWIFKDPERREAIVERYNELFNSVRPREYDGSHLTFPMMNADIHLHDHQKNAIAHAMFGGNTLFAHSVGAGKTFEMIATAMESKRLGLCTKSLFAVPNHLTEQIGDDFQKLYPGANILVATKKDFQKANRQQLFAKIATGNYDAVIIGHSQLGMIPVSKERREMEIQSQIDDILQGIEELKKQGGSKFQIKAMERTRKSLQKQLDKLEKANQDDTITFEQLGIDKLFVDEAHEFKNLFTPTKLTNVAGISSSASQKALDLFLKCRYLDEKTGGKGVVFATGTPISNSVTELHTMMRYLEYDFLKEHGLQHFDNWVSTFGDQKTDWELKPAGNGFKERTRIAQYTGMPELMSMFKQVADIRTADTLKLDVPDCDYQVVQVEATPFQKMLVQELSDRADAINGGNVDPSIDNMLKIVRC